MIDRVRPAARRIGGDPIPTRMSYLTSGPDRVLYGAQMYAQSALQLSGRPCAVRSFSPRTTLVVVLAGLLLALFGTLAGLAPTLSARIQTSPPAAPAATSRAVPQAAAVQPSPAETSPAVAGSEESTSTVVYFPLSKRNGVGAKPRQKPVAPPADPQDPKQNVPILPTIAVPLPVSQTDPPRVRQAANAQIARRVAAAVDRPPASVPPSDFYRSPVSPTGAGSAGHAVDTAAPIRAGPASVFL